MATAPGAEAGPRPRGGILRLAPALPAAGLLLALAVRLYGLTYHSLWFDEVMSTFWAARPAGEIWRVGLALTQDKHPPLYYLLLHGWTLVFGPGDAAVRVPGVALGALAVLPAYCIGRALGGARAAACGALLLALNPFLVWYSQEARMFMPATTLLLFGLWGLLLLCTDAPAERGPDGAPAAEAAGRALLGWLLCVAGLAGALYTYLFSALLLPVAGLWLLVLCWPGRRQQDAPRRLALGAAALLAVGLLFLPLARAAWAVSGAEATPGRAFAGMGPALAALLRVYAIGWPRWPQPWPALAAAAAGLLALGGLAWRSRGGQDLPAARAAGGALLALWLAVPTLIGGLLLARDRTVFAEARYFIFLAPALCLAWGRALAWLSSALQPAVARALSAGARRGPRLLAFAAGSGRGGFAAGLALLLALLPVLAVSVPALAWDWRPENRREAWREAAAFVAAHAGPHDAVLIQADYVHLAFERYFRGPQPVFYPFTGPLADPAQVDPPLAGLAGFDAIWLVQSHGQDLDPANLIAGWFGARFPLITEVFPPGIAIHSFAQHYRTPGLPAGSAERGAAGGVLGDLRLLACLYGPQQTPARDDLFHPPSAWVHVTTYWAPAGAVRAEIVPDLRVVDPAGQVWGAGLDRPGRAFHVWPTTRWLPGEVVRADDDVNLNPVTPRGAAYRLIVQAPGAAAVECGQLSVE